MGLSPPRSSGVDRDREKEVRIRNNRIQGEKPQAVLVAVAQKQ